MKLYESGEYRSTKQWPYAISAGCVVYRKHNGSIEVVLLLRKAGDFPKLRDNGVDSYHLPKGHVNVGETLEQTALRETAEEAGCQGEIQTYLGAKVNQYEDHGINRDKIVHYFAAEWKNDLGEMDREHSARLWAPLNKAIELVGNSNPKREDEIIQRLAHFLELTV